MVRVADNSAAAQLRALPSQSQLQAELIKCQTELQDILSSRDTASAIVGHHRTMTVQELLEARNDLTLVYANIQEDIDRVGDEIRHLRHLVDQLSGGGEGVSAPSRHQEFARVRMLIESAQVALRSLEERQKEVFSRITGLQVMLTRQASLESAFERHRIHRILSLEQSVKEILNTIKYRQTVKSVCYHGRLQRL